MKSRSFSEQFRKPRKQKSPQQIIGIKCSELIFFPYFESIMKKTQKTITNDTIYSLK